jgi:hypothetical protein
MKFETLARQVGKSERARQAKEEALQRGQTVVECKPGSITKWRRVRRKGRSFDVVEDLKPAFGGTFKTVSSSAPPTFTEKTPEG